MTNSKAFLALTLLALITGSTVKASVIRSEDSNAELTTTTPELETTTVGDFTASIREKRSLDLELEATTIIPVETTTMPNLNIREKRSIDAEDSTTVGQEIFTTTLTNEESSTASQEQRQTTEDERSLTTEVTEKSQEMPETEDQKFVVITPVTSGVEKSSSEESTGEKNKKKKNKKRKQDSGSDNTDDDSGTDDSDNDD